MKFKKLYTKLNKIYKMSIPKGKRNINRIQIFIIIRKAKKNMKTTSLQFKRLRDVVLKL